MAQGEVRRTAFETARLKMARVQVDAANAKSTAFRLITQIVAEALAVERSGIWFLEDLDRSLRCADLFIASDKRHEPGGALTSSDYPVYMKALRERRAIVADDALHHEDTRELAESYLVPNGITSMLDAPIIRKGRVIGVVCHEHVGPKRVWTEREIDFAGSAADIAALVLEQADRVELEAALKIRTEERLENQKLDAMSLMARSVAHDLNNVLVACVGVADQLKRGGRADSAELAESLFAAAEAGKRLSRKLLDVGLREQQTTESADIGKVLNGLLSTLRSLAGPKIEIIAHVRDRATPVRLSESDLERIFLNLVANARDATSGSGRVDITVRAAEPDDDVAPDFVILEAADNGSGMDARTREHLFEPYFTTKPDGHGLGLPTVYGIVRRGGGTIHVASELRRGSSFRIALPRYVP
jgi:signal transduction histidine kinase